MGGNGIITEEGQKITGWPTEWRCREKKKKENRQKTKQNTTKNKFSLLTSWFRPRYAKMRHLNQIHTFKTVVSVCSNCSLLRDLCPLKAVAYFADTVGPNMRKPCWNRSEQCSCFSYKQETNAMSDAAGVNLVPKEAHASHIEINKFSQI